jgi:hypothetical protein
MNNEDNSSSETNYILREYFKNFKINQNDLLKIKTKINKIDRDVILDSLVKQDKDVYDVIAENYSSTVDMVK